MFAVSGRFNVWKTAALAVLATLAVAFSGLTERSDRWWFDSLQRESASRTSLPDDTALVMIDEHALAAMSEGPLKMRWPWPRAAFAALITGLHSSGAERIVVDLIFFENSAAAEQDLLLGAIAGGIDGVTLATVPERLPAVWPQEFRQTYPELFSAKPKWGFVRSMPDDDSVIRRYLVAGSLAETLLEPGARLAAASEPARLLRWRGNLEQLRSRGVPLLSAAPYVAAGWEILDQATQSSPDFNPYGLVNAISAASPLTGSAFEQLRGKTVFVGANAAATFDAIATPLGAPEPGVILQWNAFANLYADDFISSLPIWTAWVAALAIIMLLTFSGRAGMGMQKPVLVALGCLVVVSLLSVLLFLGGWWFTPGLPIVATALCFTFVTVENLRVERLRKQEIQGWFGAYVSPAVVDKLVEDPEAIELGGEFRELTILFSDIAGFTTISEGLPAEELVTLINRFLDTQTEPILDLGGYLDKYIGDAIMAVFGSPEPLENHAVEACRAALRCREALHTLNDEIEKEYGMRLGMRTGINTGDVVVGNVGSTRKKNYTVLGDAVNLASRLEGANKQTGTSILLGPVTASYAKEEMVLRPVARLQVKGKTQAVDVFELLAEKEGCNESTLEFAETFARGFKSYCDRNFSVATEFFDSALEMRPKDMLSEHYRVQAKEFIASPPKPDWQGILKLETK
jgi:adenylate cyclase